MCHEKGRSFASRAKSRLFAVTIVIPCRPALIASNASFVKRALQARQVTSAKTNVPEEFYEIR